MAGAYSPLLLLLLALNCITYAESYSSLNLGVGFRKQFAPKLHRGGTCFSLARSIAMKLDVAPQVISAFPTAQEQNECLAVVNAAVAALNKSEKCVSQMGKAGDVTYIIAAGRPRQGVISVRFNCRFTKGATSMRPGFVPLFGQKAPQEEQGSGPSRGSQVAQVSCQVAGGEILELTVDVDGGWGRRLLITGNFGGATW